MQTKSDTAAWLRLQLTPGVGAVASRRLLAAFSLPQNIFQQSPSTLRAVVSEKQSLALLREPDNFQAALQGLEQWLEQSGQSLITLGDANYPQSLLLSPDPPLCLYLQCADALWWQAWAKQAQAPLVGVVGSRKPSPQGVKIAQTWAQEIAQSGFSVVSGLALGVDAAAHQGALQAPHWGLGRSIAVVGTGLDQVYPKQHADLAQQILDAGGAIISEYPLGTPAIAANFPKRNRIIAGLGLGVLVVEAALQSGSLITARLAMEANREVFAVPGSIYALQSQGCHALIKQGAQLVESAQELIQTLPVQAIASPSIAIEKLANKAGFPLKSSINQAKNLKKDLAFVELNGDKASAAVVEEGAANPLLAVLGFSPMALDAMLLHLPCSVAQLQMDLLQLELAGKVARLPGGLYQRIV